MIRHLGNFDASFQTSTLPETNSQFVPGNRPGPRQEETRKPSNVSFREGKEYLWIHMIHHFPTKKPMRIMPGLGGPLALLAGRSEARVEPRMVGKLQIYINPDIHDIL